MPRKNDPRNYTKYPKHTDVAVVSFSPRYYVWNLLGQEFADQATLVFVVDASEEFGAKRLDSFRAVERQLVVYLAPAKVTGLAASDNGFDLGLEVDFWRRNDG